MAQYKQVRVHGLRSSALWVGGFKHLAAFLLSTVLVDLSLNTLNNTQIPVSAWIQEVCWLS